MGIWSNYIFVNPSGLKCDMSNMNKSLIDLYNRHCKKDADLTNHSVDYIFSLLSDCAKICGYFDDEEIMFWKTYLSEIQKQNNNIRNIEFHLYCEDYNFPYIIGLFDGNFKIIKSIELDPIWTEYNDLTDECEDCNSNKECEEEHIVINFSKEKYIKYMSGIDKKHTKRLQGFDDLIKL